jgi:hypothetical protein
VIYIIFDNASRKLMAWRPGKPDAPDTSEQEA